MIHTLPWSERHSGSHLPGDGLRKFGRGDAIQRDSHCSAEDASIKGGDPFRAVTPEHDAVAFLHAEAFQFTCDLGSSVCDLRIGPSNVAVSLPVEEGDVASVAAEVLD